MRLRCPNDALATGWFRKISPIKAAALEGLDAV
jgi:hypothetical protein